MKSPCLCSVRSCSHYNLINTVKLIKRTSLTLFSITLADSTKVLVDKGCFAVGHWSPFKVNPNVGIYPDESKQARKD